jgi:peptidoglycan/xylan/chitin deacetylase (PgdA/CDA1 family)
MRLNLPQRARDSVRRLLASRLARRELPLRARTPIVSFSFDDAPESAFRIGARILQAHDAHATYYVCLGLAGAASELGRLGGRADIERVAGAGHELGCHTYDHHDAWNTSTREYLASIERNRAALAQWLPAQDLRSFAYPKNGATIGVKQALRTRFDACRGGGQTFNAGSADLGLLRACFIDARARMTPAALQALIEGNAAQRGWLIFAAHAIADDGSAYACAPSRLEALLRQCLDSGARVLPVGRALAHLKQAAAV